VKDVVVAVLAHPDAIRTVRTTLMRLAYRLADEPGVRGHLVLEDSGITEERMQSEWVRAARVLRADILDRITVSLQRGSRVTVIPPGEVPSATATILQEHAAAQHQAANRPTRPDYGFVILKLLMHQWLMSDEPVTSEWLGRTAGCSYPTVARALKALGSIVERSSDRRVRLRYFPREEFERLVATSERARSTIRFADRSGQPRTPESRVRRLEKLSPANVAIGGVLGARHYVSELDLVGTPRLDLSVHCRDAAPDLTFISELDPALEREDDPHKPASVVVHAMRHADPLTVPREGGLAWADPIECVFDLREARLASQAGEFLETMTARRKVSR
jgi:hypothetical protein